MSEGCVHEFLSDDDRYNVNVGLLSEFLLDDRYTDIGFQLMRVVTFVLPPRMVNHTSLTFLLEAGGGGRLAIDFASWA